jgi:hypothetical protein
MLRPSPLKQVPFWNCFTFAFNLNLSELLSITKALVSFQFEFVRPRGHRARFLLSPPFSLETRLHKDFFKEISKHVRLQHISLSSSHHHLIHPLNFHFKLPSMKNFHFNNEKFLLRFFWLHQSESIKDKSNLLEAKKKE